MPVTVNLRHMEDKSVHVQGQLPAEDLDIDTGDEMIRAVEPVEYSLEVEHNGNNLLVQGRISTRLDCECVRCLKPFKLRIELDPYHALIPLEGEDRAEISNDLVDLAPYMREDVLLALPQHPVCESACANVPARPAETIPPPQARQSAWDELNKLKFD